MPAEFAGHYPNPHQHIKPATMEDVMPSIEEAANNIWKLGLPDSKFFEEHASDALGWSIVILNKTSDCCAYHKVMEVGDIEREMKEVLTACMTEDCPQIITHEFIMAMIDAIDVPMRKLVRDTMVKQMLQERVN